MAQLPQWPAIVNLPSLAKFYGGRVIEAMAAGRPVISWNIPDHPQNLALFEPEKDILLFEQDDPAALAQHIDRVLHDHAFAQALAQQAQGKITLISHGRTSAAGHAGLDTNGTIARLWAVDPRRSTNIRTATSRLRTAPFNE